MVGNPFHGKDGKFSSSPEGGKRWGRMNSTEKARLTASAQFKTKMSGGKQVGRAPSKVQGDEKMYVGDPKTGRSFPVWKYEESKHAVAIQTKQALDRDFHAARQKADQEAMKIALAKHKGPVTKYPDGPKPKYGPKGKMK